VFCIACLLLLPGLAFASSACESPKKTISSDSVSDSSDQAKLKLDWKRAIDQDNSDDLWRLMPHVDVSGVNEKGKTAIMAAAKLGDHCLLEALLDKGLKIQDRSSTGGTALMYAVLGNELNMINYLLPHASNVDAQSTNGWTALMIGAAKGFDEAVALLVDAGADPDLADVYQWSPLMRAIDNSHSSVVNYLLTVGTIDINHTNENGSSALHIAATMGDISTSRQLLRLNVDVSLRDKNGFSAKQIANEKNFGELVKLIRQAR